MDAAEHPDFARGDLVGAEDRPRDLRSARADEAAKADDLALAHGQVDVGDAAVAAARPRTSSIVAPGSRKRRG